MVVNEDPFPSVQQEVRTGWKSLSSAAQRLPSAELRKRVSALEADLNDLSDAVNVVKQNRSLFRISEEELASREKFISDMTRNIRNLKPRNQSDQNETWQPNDSFVDPEQQQQELIMQNQDAHLGELASAVERIGVLGRDMHQELEEQGQILDEFGDEFDETTSRIRNVQQRLDRFIAETGPRQFCMIVVLSITFVILTVLVVVT